MIAAMLAKSPAAAVKPSAIATRRRALAARSVRSNARIARERLVDRAEHRKEFLSVVLEMLRHEKTRLSGLTH
jgi:hypothetical protein